jgi:hypothetical protein
LEVDGFDEDFDLCEDYDLILRMLLYGNFEKISDELASFHFRPRARGSSMNSSSVNSHAVAEHLFIEALLKRDLNEGKLGLGWLLLEAKRARSREPFLIKLKQLVRRMTSNRFGLYHEL